MEIPEKSSDNGNDCEGKTTLELESENIFSSIDFGYDYPPNVATTDDDNTQTVNQNVEKMELNSTTFEHYPKYGENHNQFDFVDFTNDMMDFDNSGESRTHEFLNDKSQITVENMSQNLTSLNSISESPEKPTSSHSSKLLSSSSSSESPISYSSNSSSLIMSPELTLNNDNMFYHHHHHKPNTDQNNYLQKQSQECIYPITNTQLPNNYGMNNNNEITTINQNNNCAYQQQSSTLMSTTIQPLQQNESGYFNYQQQQGSSFAVNNLTSSTITPILSMSQKQFDWWNKNLVLNYPISNLNYYYFNIKSNLHKHINTISNQWALELNIKLKMGDIAFRQNVANTKKIPNIFDQCDCKIQNMVEILSSSNGTNDVITPFWNDFLTCFTCFVCFRRVNFIQRMKDLALYKEKYYFDYIHKEDDDENSNNLINDNLSIEDNNGSGGSGLLSKLHKIYKNLEKVEIHLGMREYCSCAFLTIAFWNKKSSSSSHLNLTTTSQQKLNQNYNKKKKRVGTGTKNASLSSSSPHSSLRTSSKNHYPPNLQQNLKKRSKSSKYDKESSNIDCEEDEEELLCGICTKKLFYVQEGLQIIKNSQPEIYNTMPNTNMDNLEDSDDEENEKLKHKKPNSSRDRYGAGGGEIKIRDKTFSNEKMSLENLKHILNIMTQKQNGKALKIKYQNIPSPTPKNFPSPPPLPSANSSTKLPKSTNIEEINLFQEITTYKI